MKDWTQRGGLSACMTSDLGLDVFRLFIFAAQGIKLMNLPPAGRRRRLVEHQSKWEGAKQQWGATTPGHSGTRSLTTRHSTTATSRYPAQHDSCSQTNRPDDYPPTRMFSERGECTFGGGAGLQTGDWWFLDQSPGPLPLCTCSNHMVRDSISNFTPSHYCLTLKFLLFSFELH